MNTINESILLRQLKLHEGVRLKPYRCTEGKLTIGIGRNLDDRGITVEEANTLLRNDVAEVMAGLAINLPWIWDLNETRQRVLVDMAFNLGVNGLLEFRRTLAAIEAGQYEHAADMMLNSRWASQVGERARRLSQMMATGETPRELLS